MTCIRIN